MKIIIVGAGIGGLSAYLALKKHLSSLFNSGNLTIVLVEAYPSPSQHTYSLIGSGLGLAPNGQRAIASVSHDGAALAYIQSYAYTKGSHMTFRNAKGKALGSMRLGSSERYGYAMCMLPRAIVHDALLKEIDEKDVRWGCKVVGVREADGSESGILVEFEDGTKETADLVIGADGVRSIVQRCLFSGNFPPVYEYVIFTSNWFNFPSCKIMFSGLTGVGGFLPVSSLPVALQKSLETEGVTMTFGRSGFFGYSLASPLSPTLNNPEPFIQWWSIYETDTIPDRKTINYQDIKAQLLKRHGDWLSPYDSKGSDGKPIEENDRQKQKDTQRVFLAIIELAFQDDLLDSSNSNSGNKILPRTPILLPRYVTPRLPTWTNVGTNPTYAAHNPNNRGRIILLGDAAHTMPPDVGQGVSCAAEDSVVYASLLKHYLSLSQSLESQTKVFQATAKAYEIIRQPRIHRILDQAKYNASAKKEMNFFTERVRDFAMWILCALSGPSLSHSEFGLHL